MPNRDLVNGRSRGGMTVIELVSRFGRGSFGLGYAGLNIAAALERTGVNVFLASLDEEKDAYEACEAAGFPRERFVPGSSIGYPPLRIAPFMVRRLLNVPNNGRVIVHLHGMWTYVSYVAGTLTRRWQCPLVLSPHGELEPYALTISSRKKALASLLYGRRNLTEASCLWALSEQEKASIRAYGFPGRVAVIPNGVNRAVPCSGEEVSEFRSRHDVAAGSRVLLFLSRIARKKNLPLLLKAFAKNVKTRPEWILLIAGGDERGHIHEVQALIRDLGIEKSVRMIGPVFQREKACAFTSASVFVLPSHSEGLPIAVLEAMEYGKPVLLTDGWTLPVTTCAKFGWRVSTDERAFDTALLEAMNSPEDTLAAMGRSARSIVREQFDWDSIAQQACSLYESLLVGGQEANISPPSSHI
jgi:poly(glycerol-phosphate) alpha-glucosyltransferase